MSLPIAALPGQDTMLACWRTLGEGGFGPGRLLETPAATLAVFPGFAFLNNAVLTAEIESAQALSTWISDVYAQSRVTTWALWVPSETTTFDASADRVSAMGALRRDVTTLAMRRELRPGFRMDRRVRRVSAAALHRLMTDEAVAEDELGPPDLRSPVLGWALVEDGQAVSSAYTFHYGTDCGIYAVGTRPEWRRRGLARALLEHVLAHAHGAGMRTATLQSTPMGQSLYETVGFRTMGRYEEWLHAPADMVGDQACRTT